MTDRRLADIRSQQPTLPDHESAHIVKELLAEIDRLRARPDEREDLIADLARGLRNYDCLSDLELTRLLARADDEDP